MSPPSWLGSGLKHPNGSGMIVKRDVSPPSWLGSGLKQRATLSAATPIRGLPTFLAGEWIETLDIVTVLLALNASPHLLGWGVD